jgi:hypothetical protein
MTEFSVTTTIRRPLEIVVAAMMNADNQVFWMRDLESFEVVKGAPGETGAVARLHYLQKGRRYVMEDRLIYCEPGKKYVSRVSGDYVSAEVEINLAGAGSETGVSIRWQGTARTLLLKLILPLQRKKMIRQTREDIEVFKRLVEERGAVFSKGVENENPE